MTSEAVPVDPPEELEELEESSEFGRPGLTWAGDGALSAGRAPQRTPLDVEFEIYPPALEQGEDGFPLASFNRRWVGFVIDTVVIIACAFAVTVLVGEPENADAGATAEGVIIATLIRLGYGLIFNPRGWSPGKLVVGVRIVNEIGEAPGLRWGVMRTAATVFSELFYIGYIWAFFDAKTQTWHDKLAKTYVVYVEGDDRAVSGGWRR